LRRAIETTVVYRAAAERRPTHVLRRDRPADHPYMEAQRGIRKDGGVGGLDVDARR
jgi:hypothetical protein